jgi:hypothetical protein
MSPAASTPTHPPMPPAAPVAAGASSIEIVQQAKRGGRAVGAMFFVFFGGWWLLIAYQLAKWHDSMALALVLAAAVTVFLAALRIVRGQRSAMLALRKIPEGQRMRRQFIAINAVQWSAIVGAILLLPRLKLEVWIVPAIMLIVGLHFLPLARVFRYRPHYLTGAVLIVTAVLYPLASTGGPSSALGSLVAGVTLWLAALWSLRPAAR